MTKMAFDKENVKQKIAVLGEKINAEVDPRILDEYRILFKKGFSFFRRSWAAAYLLMLYDQGFVPGRERGSFRSRSRSSSWEGKEKVQAEAPGKRDEGESGGRVVDSVPRPFLAEEESRRLFISVGRNRHVFPREILGLIITRAQVAREDIGMIRILDSYSFVQVRDTVADKIIEALNGTQFRGRSITANYARLKREEGPVEDGTGASSAFPADTSAETSDTEGYGPPPDDPDDAEPDGDLPGGSEQGDDQDDEKGVEADTPQE
jgi:hypothetical protein